MTVQASYVPDHMDFGPVAPGAVGPNTSDPTFGPPGISFTGGVQIKSAPVAAMVTARIDRDTLHFKVRDVTVMEWTLEEVPPDELPPGHKGKPPKVKVLEIVNQGDGSSPLPVAAGQFLLVRVEYLARFIFSGSFSDNLIIESDTWDTITVPVSFFLAEVTTQFPVEPLVIARGETINFPIQVSEPVGPPTDVTYGMSPTQLHTGISIVGTIPSPIQLTAGTSQDAAIVFRADPDAPLGDNALAIDQFAFGRHGMFLPVKVTDQPQGPGVDSAILWHLANPLGINISAEADGWNAGRVHDVISLGNQTLLVGTNHGGVWTVTSAGSAIPQSDDWDDPDVICLARGLDDPNHFYAGCQGGTVYESEPDSLIFGHMDWHPLPLVDPTGKTLGIGTVYRIAVIQQNRKLVLACQSGVFWADLPAGGGVSAFRQVGSLPGGTFSGATPGPNGSVVVGAWGDGKTRFGIYFGDWSSGDLVFQKMNVPGDSTMFWTTLASCDGNLNRMYAAGSDSNGRLISLLRHDHASDGMNWQACSKEAVDAPTGKDVFNSGGDSTFGGWIKTLRVSPTNPDVVTLNWARSFRSGSGGRDKWISVDQIPGAKDAKDWSRSPEWNQHMHEDGHATVFDMDNEQTLYIATDGGVGMTPDFGKTYVSKFNRELATLMFASQPAREGLGNFSVSFYPTGLIAGGLQDNGDVYCQLTPDVGPWQEIRGGDGIGMQFLPVGQRLIWYVNDGEGVKFSRWDGSSKFVDTTVIPLDTNSQPVGLVNPIMEAVERPLFRDPNTGQLMVAVGCALGTGSIYGLFGDVDGGNLKWQSIGFLPPFAQGNVTAIGSLHGDIIWIGTSEGRIFSLGARRPAGGGYNPPFEFATPRATNPGQVDHFLIMGDELAYAAYNTAAGPGMILELNFFSWDPLGANSNVAGGVGLPSNEGAFYGLAADRDAIPHTLFVATDNHVYVSRDDADTWKLAVFGLPKRPHCTELRVDSADPKNKFLYLSTFGRSLWRARL